MKRTVLNRRKRAQTGHCIAEFGPALFLGIVGFFMPSFALICLGVDYFSCYELNDLETSEACKVSQTAVEAKASPLVRVMKRWESSGLGRFVDPVEDPVTKVNYVESPDFGDKSRDTYVTVTTTVKCRPFINVPLLKDIAGVGAPLTLTLANQSFCEYPSIAKK